MKKWKSKDLQKVFEAVVKMEEDAHAKSNAQDTSEVNQAPN